MTSKQHSAASFTRARLLPSLPSTYKSKFLSLALCGVSFAAFAHTAHSQTVINEGESREASSLSGDIENNGTITISGGSPSLTGTISGTGGIRDRSTGTLTLTGNNTYSGNTHVSSGSLTLSGQGSLPNSAVFASWGQPINIEGVTGSSASVKSLSGTSILNLGSKTLVIENGTAPQDGNITYIKAHEDTDPTSGVYRGWGQADRGGITIAGGTEALYGYSKDYSGDTTINQGATLLLGPLMSNFNEAGAGNSTTGLLPNSAIVNSGTVRTFIPKNIPGTEASGGVPTTPRPYMVQNKSITNTSTGVLDLGDGLNAKGGIINTGGSVTLRDKAQTTTIVSQNGTIELKNEAQANSITNTGDHGSVSLDNSKTIGNLTNENGNVTLQNGSSVGGALSNTNGDVSLEKSTVTGALTSSNGIITLQNGSEVASIKGTGDKSSVSLDASTSKGDLSNENGNVTLQNGSSVGGALGNTNGDVSLEKSTVTGALTSSNGIITLQNGSEVASIKGTGDKSSVSLDASTSKGDLSNENGNVTLQNGSSVGGALGNTNGNVTVDKGTVTNALTNSNGVVTLQNGSEVGSITGTGDHSSVSLNGSTSKGDLSNENGNVTLQNNSTVGGALKNKNGGIALDGSTVSGALENSGGNVSLVNNSQAGDLTNSGDNTSVTLDQSRVDSLKSSGQNTQVSLNKGTVDGKVDSTNGAVTLQNGSEVGSIESKGDHASVSLNGSTANGNVSNENGAVGLVGSTVKGDLSNKNGDIVADKSTITGALSNDTGNVTLQNASQAGDIKTSNGNTSLVQGSSAASLAIDHVNLALDNATINGSVSVNNADNTLLVGPQGATINTLDVLNGSFKSSTLQGDLSVDSLKGNLNTFPGGDHTVTIKNANGYALTLAGNETFNQKYSFNNGTVHVGNDSSYGAITGNLNVNGHISLDNSTDTTQSGTFSGDTDLTQNTNVTTTFTGDNSYTGSTVINAGGLEVNGNQSAATGDTYMAANTRLSGQGTIGGSVSMAENSTLTPGTASNPLGTLTINKDLTMDKGSTLVINALSQPTGETIKDDEGNTYNRQKGNSVHVNGTASFNGNNFRLHVTGDPTLRYGQAYVIATSDKPINVADLKEAEKDILANSNINSNSAFTKAVLKNIEDPVLALVGERNGRSFAEAGTTRNTIATGFVMNELSMNQPVAQAFASMSLEEARSHLGAFSGEVHASVRTALIQDSVYVRQAALDRLDSADCDGSPSNGISTASLKTGRKTNACLSNEPVLWGRALGSLGHNSGDGNASTMHHSTAGFVMGLDAPVYDTWRVGGMIAYGHSMFNMGGATSSSGRSDNVSIGAYAGRHWGNLHLRLGASYTWNIMGMNRTAMAGSYSDRLSSNYMGGTAQGFGELAYKLHLGQKSLIEPFANVAYVNQQTDSYREHGGAAALAGKAMNTGVTFATFGARASTNVKIGRTLFTPHGSVAYRHAFGLTTPTVHQNFASSGARTGMSIGGVPLSQDSAVVDTGISAKLSDRINVDLSYIGQYGNQSVDSGAQASVKTSF